MSYLISDGDVLDRLGPEDYYNPVRMDCGCYCDESEGRIVNRNMVYCASCYEDWWNGLIETDESDIELARRRAGRLVE
jgi:hypothetical protein